jgi:hypothetical protein
MDGVVGSGAMRILLTVALPLAFFTVPNSAVHVTMVGFVFLRTYPGPPNYGSTVPYYTNEDIQWIQLLLSEDDYPRMRKYLHKHVELQGTLAPGESGHHHTLLVYQVDRPLEVRLLDP